MRIIIASDTDYGVPFISEYDDQEHSYFQAKADAEKHTGRVWRYATDLDIEIHDTFDEVFHEIEAITDDSGIAWDSALAYIKAEYGRP